MIGKDVSQRIYGNRKPGSTHVPDSGKKNISDRMDEKIRF